MPLDDVERSELVHGEVMAQSRQSSSSPQLPHYIKQDDLIPCSSDSDSTIAGYTADVSSTNSSVGDSTDNTYSLQNPQNSDTKLGLVIDVLHSTNKNKMNYHKNKQRVTSLHKDNDSTHNLFDTSCHSIFPASICCSSLLNSNFNYRLLSLSDRQQQRRRRHRRRKSQKNKKDKQNLSTSKVKDAGYSGIGGDLLQYYRLLEPSPIHPDIDFSITKHIMTNDLLGKNNADADLHGRAGDNKDVAFPALSKAVLNYYNELKKQLVQDRYDTGLAVHTQTVTPPLKDDEHVMRRDSKRKCLSSDQNRSKPGGSPAAKKKQRIETQVISDVASFSDRPYTLEDALDLTDTPRLLLEVTSPHRVIHVNAAFSKKIIAASARNSFKCVQDWMDQQNNIPKNLSGNRSLQRAIEDIIPDNVSTPLTWHPVLGEGRLTHYLIQASTSSDHASSFKHGPTVDNDIDRNINNDIYHDTMKMYKPFEAIG